MNNVALEITKSNVETYKDMIEYILQVEDYSLVPNLWNGYYLVIGRFEGELLSPPEFDRKYMIIEAVDETIFKISNL